MRITILAASLMLALAAVPGPARADTTGTAATQGQLTKSKTARKVKGLTGVTGATTGTFATELTAQECENLGGTVYESDSLCKSGKYCGRADENGVRHRVCLEAAAQ
jgi:hypothetical protein